MKHSVLLPLFSCLARLRWVLPCLLLTHVSFGQSPGSFTINSPLTTTVCAGSSVNLSSLITTNGGSVRWSKKPQATAIAAGGSHSLALLSTGQVVGWGGNGTGQITVPASATPATAIAAGDAHSLALLANGAIVGWGDNSSGQITVPASATPATAIAARSSYSLALKANGAVVGWGDNTFGQITVPASATPATAIATGDYHGLALEANGAVVGWGYNGSGQITVPASATPATAIAAGGSHSLALKANGAVVGWGYNIIGQITVPASATPAIAIAAGEDHSLALKANGTVVGWGNNGSGQTSVPASVTTATAIAAGNIHSLALLANGSVVGWGDNSAGQTAGYDAQPLPSSTVSVTATQTYYYVIRNTNGSQTTGSVTLNINTLVAITQQPPSGAVVQAGASVSIPVSVSGTTSGYQWYKNGNAVAGQTDPTLSLFNTTPADAGSYSLVITGAGTCNYSLTSTAFSLSVSSPTPASVCPGSSVNLSSLITANGGSVRWSQKPQAHRHCRRELS